MTVKELRNKLSNFDDNAHVIVSWEDQDHLLEITNVSLATGTPSRLPSGKGVFKFESTGPASWVFVEVAEG